MPPRCGVADYTHAEGVATGRRTLDPSGFYHLGKGEGDVAEGDVAEGQGVE